MICPATLKGCCDDICLHSGCLKYGGAEPTLTRCPGCKQLVPLGGSRHDAFECECEPDYDPDDCDPPNICVQCGERMDGRGICEVCRDESR